MVEAKLLERLRLAGVLVMPITLQPFSLYSWPAIRPVALAADVTTTVLLQGASTLPVSVYSVPIHAVSPALVERMERYFSTGMSEETATSLQLSFPTLFSWKVTYLCNGKTQ